MKYSINLVAPDGSWIFPDSEEFLDLLCDYSPDYGAVDYAVRNLGCLELQITPESAATVKFHPRNVTQHAVEAAKDLLPTLGATQFIIEHLDREWRSEAFPSVDQAIARIDELCAPYFTPASWKPPPHPAPRFS